ncbi:MAG TPA: hypothetical protein VGP99_00140, partial [Tepidisphaeraceae bacterium]|nr:hypothetical protein [Tepidisphaeraceae bacterium]
MSTGFSKKGLALDFGRKLWRAAVERRFDILEQIKFKQPKPFATIGELIEAHEKLVHKFKLTVEAATVRAYRGSLRRVVVWARHPKMVDSQCERLHLSKEQRAAVDGESAAVLTEELVETFLEKYLASAGKDYQERDRRIHGALAAVRFARAMFDAEGLKCYRGLRLPDLKGFLEASLPNAPKLQQKELAPAAMKEMAAAALKLKESDPNLYLVHLLFRHFGMRNSEILNVEVGWIERLAEPRAVFLPDGRKREVAAFLALIKRPHWKPKQSEGRVPIAPDVLGELEPYLAGRDPSERLVPAEHKTARENLVNRKHGDFVRPWVNDFRKISYELRRWAATTVANLH